MITPYKKRRRCTAALSFLLLLALALLICDAAAGLASGLARGLALAAAALLCAVAKVAGLKRLNVFHRFSPP
jgi:hypothetical protein